MATNEVDFADLAQQSSGEVDFSDLATSENRPEVAFSGVLPALLPDTDFSDIIRARNDGDTVAAAAGLVKLFSKFAADGLWEAVQEFGKQRGAEVLQSIAEKTVPVLGTAGDITQASLGAALGAMGNTLKYYSKAHSAVKGGVKGLIDDAFAPAYTGEDTFGAALRPIQSMAAGAAAGWESGNVTAADVIDKPVEALNSAIPQFTVPEEFNRFVHNTTPLAAIGRVGEGTLVPNVPEDLRDRLGKGLSQGAEVAVDVMTDPLLPVIGPAFKGAGALARITGLTKVAADVVKAGAKALPASLVDKMVWAFTEKGGRLPEMITLLDKFHMDEAKGRLLAMQQGEALSKGLTPMQKMAVGNRIRGHAAPLGATTEWATVDQIPADLAALADSAREALDQMGRGSMMRGLLDSETFYRNVGKYFPFMYPEYEFKALALKTGEKVSKIKMDGSRYMARNKKMTMEDRIAKGLILEPAYPVARALQQLSHDHAVHDLFKAIMQKPEWVADKAADGFREFAGKRFGILNGKWVREDIARELAPIVHLPGKLEKWYLRAMSAYKMGKILPNPATHFRNLFSNTFMADMSPLGGGVLTVPKRLGAALDEMINNGKHLKEVKEAGAWATDFASQERALLEQAIESFRPLDSGLDLAMKPSEMYANWFARKGKKFADASFDTLSKIYSGEDNAFKLLHYIDARKSGMGIPEAVEYMRKWGMDYSRVSPVVQFMRNYTTPFIAYQAKALPRIAEVIATNPAKFYKWPVIFDAIDRMSARVHGLSESDLQYVHQSGGGRKMLTPGTDSDGNPLTMDLTYLLPWGDMQEAGQMFGIPASLSPFSNPFVMIPMQMGMNKNTFTGGEIFKDKDPDGRVRFSGENIGKGFDFVYRSIMPAIAPGSYSWEKVAKSVSPVPEHRRTKTGEPYELKRALLDVIFGLKLRGINMDKQKMFEVLSLKRYKRELQGMANKLKFDASMTDEEKEAAYEKIRSRLEDVMLKWMRSQE